MDKKRFLLVIFLVNITVFFPYNKANNDTRDFVVQVKEWRKKGLTVKQIYNKLKIKNESLKNFAVRMQNALKENSALIPKSAIHYPYQKPQDFDPKYVISDYYFLGDITVYGNKNDRWQLKNVNNALITTLKANKLQQLSPINSKTDINDNVYQDMQPFKIENNKSKFFRLTSTDKNLDEIRIVVENNRNFITLYIGNPKEKTELSVKNAVGKDTEETVNIHAKGLKIILDINKFKDYLTQTYFYKLLLDQDKYPVVGFGIGFRIDPTKIALINTANAAQVMNVFNIKPIFKITKKSLINKNKALKNDAKREELATYYDSARLDIQDKIREKNYKEPISYADLFAINAIRMQPLTSDDAKKIDAM